MKWILNLLYSLSFLLQGISGHWTDGLGDFELPAPDAYVSFDSITGGTTVDGVGLTGTLVPNPGTGVYPTTATGTGVKNSGVSFNEGGTTDGQYVQFGSDPTSCIESFDPATCTGITVAISFTIREMAQQVIYNTGALTGPTGIAFYMQGGPNYYMHCLFKAASGQTFISPGYTATLNTHTRAVCRWDPTNGAQLAFDQDVSQNGIIQTQAPGPVSPGLFLAGTEMNGAPMSDFFVNAILDELAIWSTVALSDDETRLLNQVIGLVFGDTCDGSNCQDTGMICAGDGTCACDVGYTEQLDNTCALVCGDFCLDCTSGPTAPCDVCETGYGDDGNSLATCAPCGDFCTDCTTGAFAPCDVCETDYADDGTSTSTCAPCGDFCLDCSNGANAECVTCETGYEDDTTSTSTCADIDECTADTDDCDAVNADCTNTPPGSWTCTCHEGWEGDPTACTDVDECGDGTHDCDPNANCTNTDGTYLCDCRDGYEGDGYTCTDIDECTDGLDDCDPVNADCDNTPGSWECTCHTGWEGDGVICTDIDECADGTHDCDENANCTNTDGSYTCACNTGWEGDGYRCTAIRVFFTDSYIAVDEAVGLVTLTIARTATGGETADVPHQVALTTVDVTSVGDTHYVALVGEPVAFTLGELETTFDLTINDDEIIEDDRILIVQLSLVDETQGIVGRPDRIAIKIFEDDFEFYIVDLEDTVWEHAGTVGMEIKRFGATTAAAEVSCLGTPGTTNPATVDTDFAVTGFTAFFDVGRDSAECTFDVVDDLDRELDETFDIQITSADGPVRVGEDIAVYTIRDNDNTFDVYWEVTTVVVLEDVISVDVNIVRDLLGEEDGVDPQIVTIHTEGGTAKPVDDFDEIPEETPVEFPLGVATMPVTLYIHDNDIPQSTSRYFYVYIDSTTVGRIGRAYRLKVQIEDDGDVVFTFKWETMTVDEGAEEIKILVERGGLVNEEVSVDCVASDDPNAIYAATDGVDYTGGSYTAVFAPRWRSSYCYIPITEDMIREEYETFLVELVANNPPDAAMINVPYTIVAIEDNERVTPSWPARMISVEEPTSGTRKETVIISRNIIVEDPNIPLQTVLIYTKRGSAKPGTNYVEIEPTEYAFDRDQPEFSIDIDLLGDGRKTRTLRFYVFMRALYRGTIIGKPAVMTVKVIDMDGRTV